jgi:hypothetical protein
MSLRFLSHASLLALVPLLVAGDDKVAAPPPTQAAVPAPTPICLDSIRDQAQPGDCLEASSVPTAGKLFPAPHLGGVNNVQSGVQSFVGGGANNEASGDYSVVGGGLNNRAEYYGCTTVAGGCNNSAVGAWSTVAGGWNNQATWYSAVGGGEDNVASGLYSTIGGGKHNTTLTDKASGSVIGGGTFNSIGGSRCFIGGGYRNTIPENAAGAAILGGWQNDATGFVSVVAGGDENLAGGSYSFAAGRRAMATHRGAFVWGDSQADTKGSSAQDEFSVFAAGGVRMFSTSDGSSGAVLAPGSGSWSSVSDRASKERVEAIDGNEVLERVAALPIATWSYRTEDEAVRHMGPMAQDFRAAFGLGASETRIDAVDADGVALAAIQGLVARLERQEQELAALREANEALARRLDALDGR